MSKIIEARLSKVSDADRYKAAARVAADAIEEIAEGVAPDGSLMTAEHMATVALSALAIVEVYLPDELDELPEDEDPDPAAKQCAATWDVGGVEARCPAGAVVLFDLCSLHICRAGDCGARSAPGEDECEAHLDVAN